MGKGRGMGLRNPVSGTVLRAVRPYGTLYTAKNVNLSVIRSVPFRMRSSVSWSDGRRMDLAKASCLLLDARVACELPPRGTWVLLGEQNLPSAVAY